MAKQFCQITPGIPDSEFIRGDVPMTKEEVRVIVLSKLRLQASDSMIDIGAGTGSVSIEAARLLTAGSVTAIERDAEGVALIQRNMTEFGVSNITIIAGSAPEGLPYNQQFNKVFIGGSGGNIAAIFDWILETSPSKTIVVVTAVTLDTLVQARSLCDGVRFTMPEIVQVSINKIVTVGRSDMFKAQSPIFIITTSKI